MATPPPYATPDQTGNLALAKPSPSGEAPKTRIKNPAHAFEIIWRIIDGNKERTGKGALIKGLLDGNPPYPPGKMRQNAQSWRANFNTLESESILSNAITPYYDLFSSATQVAEVRLDTDDALADVWSDQVSAELHRLFYQQHNIEMLLWQMLYDFAGFGKGFFYWADDDDPWPETIPWQRVMFPNATGADTTKWEMFLFRHRYTCSYLWSQAESPGWNKSAVTDAIRRAAPLQPLSQVAEQMDLQQELRDNDLYVSNRLDTVQAAVLYVKEFSGRWSMYVIEEDAIPTAVNTDGISPPPPLAEAKYLFKRENFYESPQRIIAPFFYELLDGSINGIGGLGRKIYPIQQTKTRLLMATVDGAFLRAYPLLQANDASSMQKGALIQFGPTNILQPGVNLQQTNLLADLEGPIAVNDRLDSLLESNLSVFKPRLEKPRGNPESATAASLRFQNATVLTNSAVNRFYQQLDRFFAEYYRRATSFTPRTNRAGLEAAKEFRDRCIAAGVPKEVLEKPPRSIIATRAIGNGSPVARQQALSNLMPIYPELGPRGRARFLSDWVASFAGQSKVEAYLPKADILQAPTFQVWMATQENDTMRNGVMPPITEGQDHRVHLAEHLKASEGAIKAVQEGGEPAVAFSFLQVALQHAQDHIQALPEKEQRAWLQMWKPIQQAAMQLQSLLEQAQAKQQQAMENQQRVMSEQELQAWKVQQDIALKEQKQAATLQQREQSHVQKMALNDANTASNIQRNAAQAEQQLAAEQQRMALDRAKAFAEMNKPKTENN